MAPIVSTFVALSASFGSLIPNLGPGLSSASISKVRTNLLGIASARCVASVLHLRAGVDICYSWELGTAAQALTELSWPALSVFNSTAFPPPSKSKGTAVPTDVLVIVDKCVLSPTSCLRPKLTS